MRVLDASFHWKCETGTQGGGGFPLDHLDNVSAASVGGEDEPESCGGGIGVDDAGVVITTSTAPQRGKHKGAFSEGQKVPKSKKAGHVDTPSTTLARGFELNHVCLEVSKGELMAVVGAVGSGYVRACTYTAFCLFVTPRSHFS